MTYFSFALVIFVRIATDWFAGEWAGDGRNYEDKNTYSYVYMIFVGILMISIGLRNLFFATMTSNASFHLFKDVIWNVLRRPMSFFDTTASGIIMNRCTKDVNDCDYQIPTFKLIFIDYLFTYIGSLIILSFMSPIHIVVILVFIFVLVKRINTYIRCSTDITRLMKLASSPILSKISEILTGYISIRHFDKKNYIKKKFIENNDLLANCDLHERMFSFYLRVRIDYSIFFIISLSFIFITFNKEHTILLFDSVSQIGLIISYIISLINMTGAFVWSMTNFMKEMSSVERIYEYSLWTDHEASWDEGEKPVQNWPQDGTVEFNNIWLKYREGLPFVLKGVQFKVENGEKVTIVGRTGSGKSTIFLALTRLIEICPPGIGDKSGSKP